MKKLVDPRGPATLLLADLCRALPPSWLPRISTLVGRYLSATDGKRRREIEARFRRLCELAGISIPVPDVVAEFFNNQFMLTIAPYVLAESAGERWDDVQVEGFEGVQEALKAGRGLVMSTLHFGTNLLSPKFLERSGITVDYVRPAFMADYKSARVQRMLGLEKDVLYLGETSGLASPVREAVRRLKQNHVVAIAFDGDQGGGETDGLVFGQRMPVRRGFLEMARLARAPMLFCLGVVKGGVYTAKFFPPCHFAEGENEQETIQRFFDLCMRQFEQTLREFPHCAIWSRPFSAAFPPVGNGQA